MQIYRRINTIKALSFDLDDTLYDNHPVIRKVESEMATWLHTHHPISANYSLQQWKDIKFHLADANPELKHDVTAWRQQQIEQGLKQLGYDDHKAKLAAENGIKHALWLRNQVDVPLETHQTLQALSKVFPLVAITNGNVNVSKIGLDRYFQLVLKAGPNGRAKPYSDMFNTTAQFLNLPPSQILHVGDHPISDIRGAITSGFASCWINMRSRTVIRERQMCRLPDIEIQDIRDLLKLLP